MEDMEQYNPIFQHFDWDTFLEEVEDLAQQYKEEKRQSKMLTKDLPWDYEPSEEDILQYQDELTTKEYKDKIKAGEEVYDEDLNPDPAKYLSEDEKEIYKQCKNQHKECSGDCEEICENLALWGDETEEQAIERVNECHVECQKKCKIVKKFCLLDQGIPTINQDGTKM